MLCKSIISKKPMYFCKIFFKHYKQNLLQKLDPRREINHFCKLKVCLKQMTYSDFLKTNLQLHFHYQSLNSFSLYVDTATIDQIKEYKHCDEKWNTLMDTCNIFYGLFYVTWSSLAFILSSSLPAVSWNHCWQSQKEGGLKAYSICNLILQYTYVGLIHQIFFLIQWFFEISYWQFPIFTCIAEKEKQLLSHFQAHWWVRSLVKIQLP